MKAPDEHTYSATRTSLLRNTAVMVMGQLMTWVSGFVLLLLLPRYLGSKEFGWLYLAMSVQMISQWLIDYGGQNYITKEVARARPDVSPLMTHAAVLRVALWLVSVALTYGLCKAAQYPWKVTVLIMILAVSNLWSTLTTMLRSCYQGFEDMRIPSLGAVAERTFLMVAAVIALLAGANEYMIAILLAVSTLLSFTICQSKARSMFRYRGPLRRSTLSVMLAEGFPYFLWSLFGIVYYRVDAVMLSIMTPSEVVGWYGAAYRFFDILMFLPAIYSQALFPILSRFGSREIQSLQTTSQKSLAFLLLAGIPVAAGVSFFAGPLTMLAFGHEGFGPSGNVLQLFAPGVLFVYVDFILGNTVVALDKQKAWAAVAFGGMVVNIVANLVLIPYFQQASGNGGLGSAIATDITEFFVMVSSVKLLPKGLLSKRVFVVAGKGIIAGCAMSIALAVGRAFGISWIPLGAFGGTVYVVSLYAMRIARPAEIHNYLGLFSPGNLRRILLERRGASI